MKQTFTELGVDNNGENQSHSSKCLLISLFRYKLLAFSKSPKKVMGQFGQKICKRMSQDEGMALIVVQKCGSFSANNKNTENFHD